MNETFHWLTAVPSTAAALIVTYWFLKYIRQRDKDANELHARTQQHLEKMALQFSDAIKAVSK